MSQHSTRFKAKYPFRFYDINLMYLPLIMLRILFLYKVKFTLRLSLYKTTFRDRGRLRSVSTRRILVRNKVIRKTANDIRISNRINSNMIIVKKRKGRSFICVAAAFTLLFSASPSYPCHHPSYHDPSSSYRVVVPSSCQVLPSYP